MSSNDLDARHLDGLTEHPRPSLAVDVALLTVAGGALQTLVVEREDGTYALPGGFVHPGESPADAATRVLRDKAGLADFALEQLYTFGAPDRDRRGWVVSVAHYALVPAERLAGSAEGTHVVTINVPWSDEIGGPVPVVDERGRLVSLGFDHGDILGLAVKRLRGRLWYTADALALLPAEFTLAEAERIFEAILDRALNTPAFRRRLLATGIVLATGRRRETGQKSRPPQLYRAAKSEEA